MSGHFGKMKKGQMAYKPGFVLAAFKGASDDYSSSLPVT